MVKPESVSRNFHGAVTEIINEIVDDFKAKALKLQLPGANWPVEEMVENLIESLEKYASTLKENELHKLHELTRGKIQKELSYKVHEVITELDDHFWETMKESYMKVVSGVISNVESILVEGFQL